MDSGFGDDSEPGDGDYRRESEPVRMLLISLEHLIIEPISGFRSRYKWEIRIGFDIILRTPTEFLMMAILCMVGTINAFGRKQKKTRIRRIRLSH